jgi:hypothetical protein
VEEIRPLVRSLARRRGHTPASLHVVPGGDHSFKVPKKGYLPQPDAARGVEDAVVQFIVSCTASAKA